ncbi:hypothetical protein REPUB_Repub03eG0155000 [Reevesia pubescens]
MDQVSSIYSVEDEKKLIALVESLKLDVVNWQISYVPREINDFADGLAKSGVSRSNNLFWRLASMLTEMDWFAVLLLYCCCIMVWC